MNPRSLYDHVIKNPNFFAPIASATTATILNIALPNIMYYFSNASAAELLNLEMNTIKAEISEGYNESKKTRPDSHKVIMHYENALQLLNKFKIEQPQKIKLFNVDEKIKDILFSMAKIQYLVGHFQQCGDYINKITAKNTRDILNLQGMIAFQKAMFVDEENSASHFTEANNYFEKSLLLDDTQNDIVALKLFIEIKRQTAINNEDNYHLIIEYFGACREQDHINSQWSFELVTVAAITYYVLNNYSESIPLINACLNNFYLSQSTAKQRGCLYKLQSEIHFDFARQLQQIEPTEESKQDLHKQISTAETTANNAKLTSMRLIKQALQRNVNRVSEEKKSSEESQAQPSASVIQAPQASTSRSSSWLPSSQKIRYVGYGALAGAVGLFTGYLKMMPLTNTASNTSMVSKAKLK